MINTQDEPPLRHSSRLLAKAHANSGADDANAANADKHNGNSSQHSDSPEHSTNNLPSFPSLNGDANYDSSSNNPPELAAGSLPPLDEDANNHPANDAGTNDDHGDKHTNPSNNTSSPFPQNEKTTKADDELVLIHHYLSDPRPLPHLHGDVLTSFFCRAARFSLADGRL